MYRRPNQLPKDTPWGLWQEMKEKAEGIVYVTTASHGGYWVSPERYKQMPEYLRTKSFAGEGWYEEDCDWCLVVLSFPDLFPTPYERYQAIVTLRGWHKARVQAFEDSAIGKRLMAEFVEFMQGNTERFEFSSSGSGTEPGRSWNSGVSIDGKTRIQWEEVSPRDFREIMSRTYMKAPFTREEAEARAIPGTFRVISEWPKPSVVMAGERDDNATN